MEKNILIQPPVSLQRRRLLLAGGVLLLSSSLTLVDMQCEETLSDDIASAIYGSTNDVSPPRLVLVPAQEGERWLSAMSSRLARYVPDEDERRRLLANIQYEASRARLGPQIISGLIGMEGTFRQYTTSGVDAHGLMQVTPLWKDYISKPSHNLFGIRTNLHYGYTILRHYNDLENGNLHRALTRFNGSLDGGKYPNAVSGAWHNRWQWG